MIIIVSGIMLTTMTTTTVATPDPDPTRLVDPNRNPGDARPKPFIKSIYQIHFINISVFVLKSLRKRFQFRVSL